MTRPVGTPSVTGCAISVTSKAKTSPSSMRMAMKCRSNLPALVRRPVDVIATFGTPASLAAKQATTTIPIVMISIGDPVRAGLVPSLARPGGNITGNSVLGPDVGAKRLQILKEVIPTVSRVAFLWNPDNASNVLQFEELQRAAPRLGVTVISVGLGPRIEFGTAFTAMTKEHSDAFAMTGEPFHQTHIA